MTLNQLPRGKSVSRGENEWNQFPAGNRFPAGKSDGYGCGASGRRNGEMEEAVNVLQGLLLALSSFSKIPVPQIEWREENMRYMMCFFPVVGLVIGLVIGLWVWLSQAIGFGPTLFGAGLALIPIAVSGGIHMDGFCDVVDAQSSHAEPARKREILKDPHAGAFAAIGVAVYIVAYAAAASELVAGWRLVVLLAAMHIASRCMSGIATVMFPTSSSKGMLSMFHESARGKRILIVLVVELAVCGVVMAVTYVPAIFVLLVGLVCLGLLFPFAQSQFGGMSGDLAGFFLQVAELAMIVALVVISKVVAL